MAKKTAPELEAPLESPEIVQRAPADPSGLFDLEAEAALLGAVLIDGGQLSRCEGLDAGAFYNRRHQAIWKACKDLAAAGEPVEYLTVSNKLAHARKLKEVGGDTYLISLTTAPGNSQSARSYARIVSDFAARRKMLADASTIAKWAVDLNIPLPESATQPRRKTRYTASEILSTHFPDATGPIPGVIPIGLTIIGSRPKIGKSRLLLQASVSWGVGGKFLEMTMPHLRVLYYSLDDPERRLQDRLNKLGLDPSASVTFEREIKPLHLGGIAEIEQEAGNYDVIVIDTIRRAMPGKDFNKDGALYDDVLGQLQTIAQNKHISIIVVLHTRKSFGQDFDPVDDVLGSTGLTASADCVLAIYKQPGKTSNLFKGRHKDFGDIDLTIEFDPITNAWQLVGITGEVVEGENENEILEAMPDLGLAKVSEIAKAIGKDRANTGKRCAKLWVKGLLRKEVISDIPYYCLPTYISTHPTQGTYSTQGTHPTQGTQAE